MNDLFDALLFPQQLHERHPDPGPFKDSRAYKPHLQREFRRKCVYCRISDGLKGYEGFGVDHYLPKSKFPGLDTTWPNLFYACNVCNTWKGDTVSAPDRFLPNPCAHRMADHLQYQGADIETYTLHGEWLAELLHFAERRNFRDFILAALGQFLALRNELLEDLTAYETRFGKDDLGSLEAAIQETDEELERVERQIELLIGEPIAAAVRLR
ncbi:MAG TPA: HNH endonuclease [Thermoanaerobaculia bacterium]|nr:HNH endonuclease [Thermoanaerobaculia bacterium]